MKKMITLMLAAALMLTCMAGVALAAEPGETVTVSFSAVNNPGFASFGAILNYDHDALELVSIEAGALCSGGGMFISNGDKLTFINVTDVTGDGVMFSATFKVKADAAAGTYAVSAAVDAPENAAGEAINLVIAGGEVVVEASECEHEWDEGVVTTPATCEAEGVKTYTCGKCGVTKTEAIPALGHAWGEWKVTTEATCEEAGVETRVCANDETHTETREVPAKGHDWGEWEVTTEATCDEAGVETRVCKNDETHVETREIPAKGHDHGDEWKYDEENHWHECSCGHKADVEAHVFENNGYCKCGYLDPNYNPGGGNDDDEPQTGDITPVIVLGVFGVMAMAATVVVSNKRKNVK